MEAPTFPAAATGVLEYGADTLIPENCATEAEFTPPHIACTSPAFIAETQSFMLS